MSSPVRWMTYVSKHSYFLFKIGTIKQSPLQIEDGARAIGIIHDNVTIAPSDGLLVLRNLAISELRFELVELNGPGSMLDHGAISMKVLLLIRQNVPDQYILSPLGSS